MRKKFNILFWLILPAMVYVSYYLMKNSGSPLNSFTGFTYNRETQINADFAGYISKIHVVSGQHVKKGELLIEMKKDELDRQVANLDYSKQELQYKSNQQIAEIYATIARVKNEGNQRISELKTQIVSEQAKYDYNKSLLGGQAKTDETNTVNPSQKKIEYLQKEVDAIRRGIARQVAAYKSQLKALKNTSSQEQALTNLQNYIKEDINKLMIYAPFDGLIGNIDVKVTEYVESYKTLMSFYEPNAKNIIGYVPEHQIVKFNIGDVINVSSILHPDVKSQGTITGKGYRIIEIPERLRQLPEYKTYGMEVYIKLEKESNFLQQEKVTLSANKSN